MTNYDAWRCHDRAVMQISIKAPNVGKLYIAPALLWRVFGIPDPPTNGMYGTGEYNFEDNDLDCFKIYDYKQTIHYHGLNREDEYYNKPRNLAKPHHKRKRKWPTVEEFWALEEPVEFKFAADPYADHRKFKRWLKAQLATDKYDEKSF